MLGDASYEAEGLGGTYKGFGGLVRSYPTPLVARFARATGEATAAAAAARSAATGRTGERTGTEAGWCGSGGEGGINTVLRWAGSVVFWFFGNPVCKYSCNTILILPVLESNMCLVVICWSYIKNI